MSKPGGQLPPVLLDPSEMRTIYGGDQFCIMVLGGAEGEGLGSGDAVYKNAFPRCTVFTVGNHRGADVNGDWARAETWERVRAREPQPHAVVIDQGSDSWLSPEMGVHLGAFLRPSGTSQGKMLVFSPPPESYKSGFNFFEVIAKTHYMDANSGVRFIPKRLCDNQLLIALDDRFEDQDMFPSEVLQAVRECQQLLFSELEFHPFQNMEVREQLTQARVARIRECFDTLTDRLGDPMPFMKALQWVFSRVTSLVDDPTDTKCK